MSDPLTSGDPGEQKRRSTRIAQAVPITVTGVDALGQPFKERTTTVTVNCHGCKYQSKHYVPKTSVVTLEIPRHESGLPPRAITGRVIWVQRPRTVRELFQIGLEFEVVGNVWGIAFPPEDWLPLPDEKAATPFEAPASSESSKPAARVDAPIPMSAVPAPVPPLSAAPPPPAPGKPEVHAALPSLPPAGISPVAAAPPAPAPPTATLPPPVQPVERKIHLVPAAEPPQEAQLTALREHIGKLLVDAKETLGKTARHDAQAAINDEMTVVRQQLDAQLHEAVERAIKVSMERVSESAAKKLMQQATERSNAIVEEARKTTETAAGHLDLKIRQAVDQAVNQAVGRAVDQKVGTAAEQAAERAAQQAADKTAAHDLRRAVQETVERFVAEREAMAPSLKILSSPEAAQQHLDSWKRDLEETAQTIRREILQQTQGDAGAAAARLHNEIEAAFAGASQKLSATLDDILQAKTGEAETEVATRAAALRFSLDETIAGSQANIQSLSDALEQGRVRTDETKFQLDEAAQAAVNRARAGLDQLLSSQAVEIARKMEEVSQAKIGQAEADASARAAALRSSLDETITGSQATIDALNAAFEQGKARTEETTSQLAEASQATIEALNAAFRQGRARAEETKSNLAEASQAAVDRARAELDQLLSSQTGEITRRADEIIAERANLLAPAIEASMQNAIAHFSEQLDHTLAPKIDEAGRITAEISRSAQQAAAARDDAQNRMQKLFENAAQVQAGIQEQIRTAAEQVARVEAGLQDRIRTASEEAIAEGLGRVRDEVSKAPAEVEQACQAAASKIEAEIDKKATEVQHETFESLSKAADWYQKKAQTSMQSSLEKAVDQSAANLRDRAAEVSSLVTSELDHHRRTYAEYSRAEMEEAANEIATRERARLAESAAVVNAGFSDEVRRVTAESLQRFQEVSLEALEKTRSDMEFNREGALAEFQKDLERQMSRGVLQAQKHLESQLAPLVETWEARRNEQQRQWMELLRKSTSESIEQYKARLENASNSWLLASATTLGQNSQSILDTLAKSAEKRLRETCTEVLAGIGDTIKDRLMGISSSFSEEPERDATPAPKK